MRMQRLVGNRHLQRIVSVNQRMSGNTIARHKDDKALKAVKDEKDKIDKIRIRAEAIDVTTEQLAQCLIEANACLVTANREFSTITDPGWKAPAQQALTNATNAKNKIESLIVANNKNVEILKAIIKLKTGVAAKFGTVVDQTTSAFNRQIELARGGLSAIVSASKADQIAAGLATAEKAKKSTADALAKFPGFIAMVDGEIVKAGVEYEKLPVSSSRTSASDALAAMRTTAQSIKEAQAVATALDAFSRRAAGHADTLATAKLLAITKADEAQKAREKATEAQAAMDEAKKAAENFQKLLETAKSNAEELALVKTNHEKLLDAAKATLAKEEKALESLNIVLAEGQAEPYMAEGMTSAAESAIASARSSVALAELALQQASSEFDRGMIDLGVAQESFNVANAKATDPAAIQNVKGSQEAAVLAEGDATRAQDSASLSAVSEQQANTADTVEQALITELRTTVGTQIALDELLTFIPDKAELKLLLATMGYDLLIYALKSAEIGLVKTKAYYTEFKDTYLKDCDKDNLKRIMRDFDVATMQQIEAEITYAKWKEWVNSPSVVTIKAHLAAIKIPKFCEWQKEYTVDELKKLISKITVEKFVALVTEFDVKDFKNRYVTDFTLDGVIDFYTEFTIPEFKVYVTTMTYAVLKDRVKVKGLKANALKKYGAQWLKDFVGVDGPAKAHLTNIAINGSNQISGGHDKVVFENYLNTVINGPTGQKRGAFVVQKAGTVSEVTYTLYYPDGSVRGTGFKTLIKDLTTDINDWGDKAVNGLWRGIKNCTFDKNTPGFRVSDGTYTFEGYYNTPKVAVDTFYPV